MREKGLVSPMWQQDWQMRVEQVVTSPYFELVELHEVAVESSAQVIHKEEGVLAAAMLAKMPAAFFEFFEVEAA